VQDIAVKWVVVDGRLNRRHRDCVPAGVSN
jgi:hypothetical protein